MKTHKFILKSDEEKNLKDLAVNKISIRKVASNSDIHSLFCPIEVMYSNPFSGVISKRVIHASTYFSNRNAGIITDMEMNEVITSCNNTILKIYNNLNLPTFSLIIEYEELTNLIDTLTIYVNTQSEGRTYSLHPSSKKQIIEKFPYAHPAGQLYTSHENEYMFKMQHGDILKPFVQGITNLSDYELLRIGQVDFIDSMTNKLILSHSFNL